MKKNVLPAILTLASLLVPLETSATNFSKLYVFGDSLSDPGNVYKVTTDAQPYEPILGTEIPITPGIPPYFKGRFSNGPVWADYFSNNLGISLTPSSELSVLSPQVSIPSSISVVDDRPVVSPFYQGKTASNSVNFAYGGAQTGSTAAGDLGNFLPGVTTQVNGFTNDLNGKSSDSNGLYVIWAGANDYQSSPVIDPSQSVGNIENSIVSLYNSGARNFVIPNLPDLGKTSRALSLGQEVSTNLTNLSDTHNLLLAEDLSNLSQSQADINIIPVDTNSLFDEILANPTKFGFTNITESCVNEATGTVGKFFARGGAVKLILPDPNKDDVMTITRERYPEYSIAQLKDKINWTVSAFESAKAFSNCKSANLEIYYFPHTLNYFAMRLDSDRVLVSYYEQFRERRVDSSGILINLKADKNLKQYWDKEYAGFYQKSTKS
jgi:phospholipase/lecithinase/hemolysin